MQDTLEARGPNAIETANRGSRMLRVVHAVGWAFIWLGALTLGFVAHQLWVTTWFAQQNQAELAAERESYYTTVEIERVEYTPDIEPVTIQTPTGPVVVQPPNFDIEEPGSRTLQVESPPEEHQAFAEIRIPKLDRLQEGWTVVEGVSTPDLKNGAGHMPWTALPGQPGNAVISGHRTTYGAPFHELDQLVAGDRIEVETALGTHIYEMREARVVAPNEVWVTDHRPGAWLTLTTCHPKFSARERLVVFAELVEGPNALVILGQQ